ncbi:MAG: NifB/NifX family molybdenum-iron cluster-binding protein [Planctomycetes bacterium]|nr:NifB/NifX family molybdenum-iron cluster-binding protein [Planctomycetota bacterium]
MKIAIPTFEGRVSPRFDCARAVLVVTIDEDKPSGRQEFRTSNWVPHERVKKLLELGVDTVICGGIDRWSATSLQSAGVTVYGWVTGEIEDALSALLCGELDAEAAMEGRGRCGCRRFPGDEVTDTGPPDPGQGMRRRSRRGADRQNEGENGNSVGLRND